MTPLMNEVRFGMNKFCGPAVLSIVTGKTTDECADAIRQITRKYEVTGVYTKDLKLAANLLGFNLTETPFVGHSLYSALTSIADKDGIYIVEITRHFVCIEIRDKVIWFCDNHTKEPMPAASSARLMQGVVGIHKVEEKPRPRIREPRYSSESYIKVKCEDCFAYVTYPITTLLNPEEMERSIRHLNNCEKRRIIQ